MRGEKKTAATDVPFCGWVIRGEVGGGGRGLSKMFDKLRGKTIIGRKK